MKIAYLSRGNSVYDQRFLEKMVERGHEVHFISYHASEKVKVEGVGNYHYDYNSIHRFRKFRSVQTALHLRKLLKRIKPDILHTGWVQDMGFFGALSGFRPTLSMPWGSDVLIRPYDSKSAMWMTRFTLNRADMITCDAYAVKKEIIKLSGCKTDKVIVFHWGIDLNIFYPSDGQSAIRTKLGWETKKIIVMTRSMEKALYGHEVFISALSSVIQQVPDARVILVADGLLKNKIKMQAVSQGIIDYIHFAGWVDEIKMAEYLNAADIYVSASMSDGTSCSLLEAMACGLPAVVTDVPSNYEWIEEGVNGFIVPRGDDQKLAKRIVNLLQNEDLRICMGKSNLELARKKANWDNNFNKLEKIYYDLVQRK